MYKDLNVNVYSGRLVEDAEIKSINGSQCAKFRLVVNNGVEEGSNKNTLYMDCEWWDPNNAVKYLKKGKKVEVLGRMMMSHWSDKNDGTSRSRPFIKVANLELRGTKSQDLNETQEHADDFVSSLTEN